MERYIAFFSCSFMLITSSATDSINASQSIRDGETMVSPAGTFELGFFSPGNSEGRYLGIWYKEISVKTVVWVANRQTPIVDSSGVLKVTNQGSLVLLDVNNRVIWSSNSSRLIGNPVAQLLDSGNLVMKDTNYNNPENFLWQSFDYPCDTLLPGMKLGRNLVTGLDRYLSSWKSSDDPSQGDFTYRLEPNGYPQKVLRKGSAEQFRSGPWNGLSFTEEPGLEQNRAYELHLVFNQKEIYFAYEVHNDSNIVRLVLNQNGIAQIFLWIDRTENWIVYQNVQADNCDTYALCGAHGICNIEDSPVCGCLEGFVPKFPREWNVSDWSNGCVRRTPLDCQSGDGFVKYSGVKLPDARYSWFNASMNLAACKMVCLKNCSCMAYAKQDIRKGRTGCLLWFGDLIDIRQYNQNGQDIFIRMSSSEIGRIGKNRKNRVGIIAGSVLFAGVLLLALGLALYLWKKKKIKNQGEREQKLYGEHATESQKEDLELPLFDFASVAHATNNFSNYNKLGEGGFGPVYKGKLDNGQEIAVKRLSKDSKQGLDEFKNEVLCIAKLQHRNLVKLLGCCIEEEKMLIYEYMPNKSLDSFIFDQWKSKLLNWHKRYHIINGIARGLLYLHQDSRLRIIHRDLKTSNILLDYEMNPKISDFGMARCFGGNETEANTTRVVGTYGYISPEYVIDGFFSVKSDVFSFGVIVLEIVSGKKNRGFTHPDHDLNLLGHAWRLHNEGRMLEFIYESKEETCNLSDVLRAIHIGLLCVQRRPDDRPSMSAVVLMLGSETALPQPKEPGFYTERNHPISTDSASSKHDSCSANEFTITFLSGR